MQNLNIKMVLLNTIFILASTFANAEIITDTDCGGECTFSYNTETQELSFSGSGMITQEYREKLRGKVVKDLTINEGITGAQNMAFLEYGILTLGTEDSVVKLPSSFTFCGSSYSCFYSHHFKVFEIAPPAEGQNKTLEIGFCGAKDVITDGKTNIIISGCYGSIPESLNIHCKGDLEKCRSSLRNRGWGETPTQLDTDYYKGYDEHGNLVEIWDASGMTKYSYTYAANGDYSLYDENGNFLGNYMSNGQKRRIYTVSEATEALGNNGKNTFKMRYR